MQNLQQKSEILCHPATADEGMVGNLGSAVCVGEAGCSRGVARKTLLWDGARYLFQGALDEEFRTVLLLMAIRMFDVPAHFRIILTSIGFLSLIFTPLTQQLASRSRWNNMQVSALYFALMGVAFLGAAFATSWAIFFFFVAVARICDKQQIPLMLSVYADNYARRERGFRVGTALACMPIGGIIFSQFAGYFLDKNPNHFCYLALLASFLALGCALCFLKIPARKVVAEDYPSLWDNFKLLAKDRLFTWILLFYSFVAIANQMTLPLRVEYLANHKRSLDISYGTILAIFAVIQPLAGVLSGPLWGKLYDRVSLVTMRQCVTACFLVGIPLFFATDDINMIYLASILLGIGRSGGVIFWSLWVAGVAPRRELGEYMSVNTAVMGLRDALTPILGYFLMIYAGPMAVGVTAFLLLVLSMLGFEFIHGRSAYRERMAAAGQ
ncbi:MAG: MFS transporter [Puniceicoccales bacterium]|jgi:MFS family permease|nr:MFS transporter [Puniceicoccales bacterium]